MTQATDAVTLTEKAVASGDIVLGPNQYGKAEVRVVRIYRDTDRHEIEDLNVTSQLRGDFSETHLTGDNAKVVATDTQKNTVYAFAKESGSRPRRPSCCGSGEHFVSSFDWVSGGRWAAESYVWERIEADGGSHDHAFVRAGRRRARLWSSVTATTCASISGLTDLVVLKSTGSEFEGFPRDKYTTLVETDDRILATAVTARWR